MGCRGCACALAAAQSSWTLVGSRGEGDTLYAESVKGTAGPTLTVNSLLDYAKPQWWGAEKRYHSTTAQWELNCKEGTYRTLGFTVYAGKMGAGDVVVNDAQPSGWGVMTAASIPGDLARWACGK